MSIKFRLTAMQFLQFFIWGAWLISLGGYMGGTLHFEGGQIGAIFATMGIASLIMPGLMGIIADKWINAERLYGTLHLIGAGALIYASTATTYSNMYWAMLQIGRAHASSHRCRCSDLCIHCHHIQQYVLGNAADRKSTRFISSVPVL